MMGRFLLARVGELITVAAGEEAPSTIQLGHATTAIFAVCRNRTHKPGPLSAEPTRGPGDGDPLFDIAPIVAVSAYATRRSPVLKTRWVGGVVRSSASPSFESCYAASNSRCRRSSKP